MNLYHIHKKNNKDELWKVGNEIEVGNENNNFINFSFNFNSLILLENQIYPFANVCDYYIKTNDIGNQINLLKTAKDFINEYQILIRELGMEEIRRKFYPHLPSRQKCIWLCGKKQIDYWKNFILGDFEIFEVEVFGKTFKSRNSLIPLPSDSYNTILEKSHSYWSEKNDVENEDDEYLYVGKIKIISKIE